MSEPFNLNNITTGKEVALGAYIDSKRVYAKRIDCGQLPGSGQSVRIPTELENVTYVGIAGGIGSNDKQFIPCNIYYNGNLTIGVFIEDGNIRIINNDSGNRTGIMYVTVFYTKN